MVLIFVCLNQNMTRHDRSWCVETILEMTLITISSTNQHYWHQSFMKFTAVWVLHPFVELHNLSVQLWRLGCTKTRVEATKALGPRAERSPRISVKRLRRRRGSAFETKTEITEATTRAWLPACKSREASAAATCKKSWVNGVKLSFAFTNDSNHMQFKFIWNSACCNSDNSFNTKSSELFVSASELWPVKPLFAGNKLRACSKKHGKQRNKTKNNKAKNQKKRWKLRKFYKVLQNILTRTSWIPFHQILQNEPWI